MSWPRWGSSLVFCSYFIFIVFIDKHVNVITAEHPESINKGAIVVYPNDGLDQVAGGSIRLQAPGFSVHASPPHACISRHGGHPGPFFGSPGYGNIYADDEPWRSARMGSQVRMVRTFHPDGRALQAVHVVERKHQLVLVLHAVDGRVCIGQVCGLRGMIPSSRRGLQRKGLPRIWNIWKHQWRGGYQDRQHRLHNLSENVWGFAHNYKRRYDVPICDDILAVLPREHQIIIVHQNAPRQKCGALLWRADVPELDSGPPFKGFIGYDCYRGKGTGKDNPLLGRCHPSWNGNGKGDGVTSEGSWLSNRWNINRSPILPSDIVDSGWPALLDVDDFDLPTAICNSSVEMLKCSWIDRSSVPVVRNRAEAREGECSRIDRSSVPVVRDRGEAREGCSRGGGTQNRLSVEHPHMLHFVIEQAA